LGEFLLFVFLSVGSVVVVAQVLREIPRFGKLPNSLLLAASHTLIVLLFLLAAPAYISWVRDNPPGGDLYGLYLIVPGFPIDLIATHLFGEAVFEWLLNFMEPFSASVICLILGPGLFGLVVGGLQWYVVGVCWDRWIGKRLSESPRST
jgi:hypothetical protein